MGRHLSLRYGQVILVIGYPVWQLSIDPNIDVQSVFSWAPKLGRKCKSKHWLPYGVDGRSVGWSVYGHVIIVSLVPLKCSTGALTLSDFWYK